MTVRRIVDKVTGFSGGGAKRRASARSAAKATAKAAKASAKAAASATAAPGRRGMSTIGRSRPSSSASSSGVVNTSSRAVSTPETIKANGLSSRCLRARSAATALSSEATHARWNPPSPFSATTPPSRRQASAASSDGRSRGPQSGQAIGCAWKRRSAGSSYSARQASHMAKPAIVVFGRSYGTRVTIVRRGPQFVQLTNG